MTPKLKVITCLAFFLLGGLGATTASNLAFPAASYGLRAQLRFFSQSCDEYQVLAIGSSFTLRNLDPETLDGELRLRGYDISTMIFGVENYTGHAIDRLTRELSRRVGSHRFALTLVEAREFQPLVPAQDYAYNVRDIWWHDLIETGSVIETTLHAELARDEKYRTTLHHLKLLSLHYLPVGRLTMLLAEPEERKYDLAVQSFDGHLPLRVDCGQVGEKLRPYLENPASWRARVDAHQARLDAGISLRHYPVRRIRGQVRRLSRWSLPIYVNFPISAPDGALARELLKVRAIPWLLDFSDPRQPGMRELWKLERHFDATHLNDEGTELFTRILAERLVLQAESSPEIHARLRGGRTHGAA